MTLMDLMLTNLQLLTQHDAVMIVVVLWSVAHFWIVRTGQDCPTAMQQVLAHCGVKDYARKMKCRAEYVVEIPTLATILQLGHQQLKRKRHRAPPVTDKTFPLDIKNK